MLARTLGRTLEELYATMSSAEFSLWLAEWEREPWGDFRGDLQAAMVSRTISNWAGRMRRDGEPALLSDFLLDFTPATEQQTAAQGEPDPAAYFQSRYGG